MTEPRRIPRYQQEERDQQEAADAAQQAPLKRIPADISNHAPHNSYAGGPLYYEDRGFTCIDCGQAEVWTAADQKWWYEVAKGPIFSTAIRCAACRNARNAKHGGTPRRSHRERREDHDINADE